mmetsp:Transcript_8312/g.31310  ORF Transcript_8312/g.31310 Transcript_8312/m.31310 type:complete len:206 (+) Transcript_8312:879-1496(+)
MERPLQRQRPHKLDAGTATPAPVSARHRSAAGQDGHLLGRLRDGAALLQQRAPQLESQPVPAPGRDSCELANDKQGTKERSIQRRGESAVHARSDEGRNGVDSAQSTRDEEGGGDQGRERGRLSRAACVHKEEGCADILSREGRHPRPLQQQPAQLDKVRCGRADVPRGRITLPAGETKAHAGAFAIREEEKRGLHDSRAIHDAF